MQIYFLGKNNVHTNNVEGIHSVIKKASCQQFGRLPILSKGEETHYLDLIVWRVNASLQRVPFFEAFAKNLYTWTNEDPLENWDRIIPTAADRVALEEAPLQVAEEEEVDEEEWYDAAEIADMMQDEEEDSG